MGLNQLWLCYSNQLNTRIQGSGSEDSPAFPWKSSVPCTASLHKPNLLWEPSLPPHPTPGPYFPQNSNERKWLGSGAQIHQGDSEAGAPIWGEGVCVCKRRDSHLLQGLQDCLPVHLQHMEPSFILNPTVRHHRHQVEADVMVGLPEVTATTVRRVPLPPQACSHSCPPIRDVGSITGLPKVTTGLGTGPTLVVVFVRHLCGVSQQAEGPPTAAPRPALPPADPAAGYRQLGQEIGQGVGSLKSETDLGWHQTHHAALPK